jgi:hypothetical protein
MLYATAGVFLPHARKISPDVYQYLPTARLYLPARLLFDGTLDDHGSGAAGR